MKMQLCLAQEEFEDTKVVIRICNSKRENSGIPYFLVLFPRSGCVTEYDVSSEGRILKGVEATGTTSGARTLYSS
jgi:hypothetical protein